MFTQKTCIIVAGPTAVGKTAFAIQLAQHFNTQIISADSRQCFKELNIGVAKPNATELKAVPHHFISSHTIHHEVNAAVFEQYALQKLTHIFSNNNIAVVVGGTGLYINALCNGIDLIPAIDASIRQQLTDDYNIYGLEWLQQQVQLHDMLYYAKGEIQNPQRLLRALEVKLGTGKSITEFQTQQKKKRGFNIVKIALQLPKEQLHHQINTRVDSMMQQGLLAEVKQLMPFVHLNALQTVGYKELFAFLQNMSTHDAAVEQIKINTRQYAKRQITWFKKSPEWEWLHPHHPEAALALVTGNALEK
jgi:tRNA dimethylallyltransferase